jgi:hypothetical protein
VTVAECLAVARHAHQEYRENVTRRVPDGQQTRVLSGDPGIARAALQRAYDALSEAEQLDPQGTDPAWGDHPHTAQHTDLLVFYRQQLERVK